MRKLAAAHHTTTQANKLTGAYTSVNGLIALRAKAKGMPLTLKRRHMAKLGGGQQSRLRGRGMEFHGVRQYHPGDDIRHIDWKVTAKTLKTHTKIFLEDRERPVHIAVDQRQTMFFGSQIAFKSVTAAEIATLLAWAAQQQGDRVGGSVISNQECHDIRPKGGKKGVLPFIQSLNQANSALSQQHNGEKQPLEDMLAHLRYSTKPGSLVFIISDFHDVSDICTEHLSLLARHNTVIGIFVYDRMEEQLPISGRLGFSSGQQKIIIDTRQKNLRVQYANAFQQRQAKAQHLFQQLALPWFSIATNDNIEEKIRSRMGLYS